MGEQKQSELVEQNASEVSGGGPVLRAISKRLRAFNKKVKRAEEIEAIKATGKEINEQQEEVLTGKAKALAVIAELERLVPLLKEAAAEETDAAVSTALMEQSEKTVKEKEARAAQQSAAATAQNGHARAEDSSASGDLSTAIARLVQLAYFTQVFNPDGGFPSAHERKVCVDYDREYFSQEAGHLTAEDLCAIARLGQMLTKRAEGQACSHQEALDSGTKLALAWISRSDDHVPGSLLTVSQLAAKFERVLKSPYASTPPTVNNEDAESVVPLDDPHAKDSPAASQHGSYPGQPVLPLQGFAEPPLMNALYEQNGGMAHLPVSLADLSGDPAQASARAGPAHWAPTPPTHIAAHQVPQHMAPPVDPLQSAHQIPAAQEWVDPALLNVEDEQDYEGGPSSGAVDFNFMVESQVADEQQQQQPPSVNGPTSISSTTAAPAAADVPAPDAADSPLPRSRSGGAREHRGRYRGRGRYQGDRLAGSRGDRGGYAPRGDRGGRGRGGRGSRPSRQSSDKPGQGQA